MSSESILGLDKSSLISLLHPLIYFKVAMIYDFLCSIKLQKPHETAPTLERGIWGNLNLCSWAIHGHS